MTLQIKTRLVAALLLAIPTVGFAQTDTHHRPDTAYPVQPPETMQAMMQMMQEHMSMMVQMMQGMQDSMGMIQGGQAMPMQGAMSDATAAFMAAMSKMDAPMMQGIQANDPDVAFVKGMIPHHQGAIDMANVELQYGDDEQAKAWARQIIAAQEKEIAEMQEWLAAHGE